MGSNASRCSGADGRSPALSPGSPFMDTFSRIELYEAELLVKAYNAAWYGRQPSTTGTRGSYDGSPPTTPLYDSDDEPTEPSGVMSALAVNSPPSSRQNALNSRPGTLPVLRSFSDPLAATAATTSSTTNIQFYPAALPKTLPRTNSSSSSSSHSSTNHRSSSRSHHSSSQHQLQTEHSAAQNMRSTAHSVYSHAMHLGSGQGTVALPLSSAVVAAAAGADNSTLQQLSLVSNQGSGVDQNFRPYHHLVMMQQRRAHHKHHHHRQQHHAVVACAQTQGTRGWHAGPNSLAEVAV